MGEMGEGSNQGAWGERAAEGREECNKKKREDNLTIGMLIKVTRHHTIKYLSSKLPIILKNHCKNIHI